MVTVLVIFARKIHIVYNKNIYNNGGKYKDIRI